MDYLWLLPAVLCGYIALIGNIVLGQQVLERKIIFIDLAVAQVAALGAALSQYWFTQFDVFSSSWLGQMLGPWVLSIMFCLLIALLEDHWKQHLEAMIGCLFAVTASLAMLLVSKDPHGGDFLKSILNGQLLWATWSDVVYLGVITALILTIIAYRPLLMKGRGFYLIFAILMPVTVKLTGIYLEFALLVIPALFTASLKGKAALWISLLLGSVGILSGLAASAVFDLPSGASIVITLFLSGALFILLTHLHRQLFWRLF
ncbi:metal ABC transporter permease [Endozoicomonas elysicola]|uniref:metal ABC transporter permease n=1 Tax=Endozoicomonas elysicola TaxID=305900 RepID=UPI00191C5295|nr:metal ABC transporter permease [Endozoicomonas elysicola]